MKRWWGLAAVAVVVALVGVGFLLVRPPRPDLPYPGGQELQSVRGNCVRGNELIGCATQGGPRSFLTVTVDGDRRAAVEALFDSLSDNGWAEDTEGETARDYSGGVGAPEDLQPLWCKDGCVGLFRFVEEGYVLAWFD